jgi:hypothetical protein
MEKKDVIQIFLAALAVIIAIIALVPEFGQWLFPRAPLPASTSIVEPTNTLLATNNPSTTITLNIRARIDGLSDLVIQGDTVSWYHRVGGAPGRWIESSTYINGIEWDPDWPDVPDRYNTNCECYSSAYEGIATIANYPPVTLEIVRGRGSVNIIQQPSQENNHTLIIEFDDVANPVDTYGDDLYEINLIATE